MFKRIYLLVFMLVCALALAACGGDKEEAVDQPAAAEAVEANNAEAVAAVEGDSEHGQELYMGTCVACHGPDAKGVPGLGKSLHASESDFVREKSDTELVEFIKVGRRPDDPLNTTGVDMPPKGGNPALSEEGMYDIVAWIRTLE